MEVRQLLEQSSASLPSVDATPSPLTPAARRRILATMPTTIDVITKAKAATASAVGALKVLTAAFQNTPQLDESLEQLRIADCQLFEILGELDPGGEEGEAYLDKKELQPADPDQGPVTTEEAAGVDRCGPGQRCIDPKDYPAGPGPDDPGPQGVEGEPSQPTK